MHTHVQAAQLEREIEIERRDHEAEKRNGAEVRREIGEIDKSIGTTNDQTHRQVGTYSIYGYTERDRVTGRERESESERGRWARAWLRARAPARAWAFYVRTHMYLICVHIYVCATAYMILKVYKSAVSCVSTRR